MTRPVTEVFEQWLRELRESGSAMIKLPWQRVYQDNRTERWKGGRQDQLNQIASDNGVVLGFGQKVVTVAYDAAY